LKVNSYYSSLTIWLPHVVETVDMAKPFHEEERWVAEDEREVPVRVFFLVIIFQESSREQKKPFSPRT